MKKGYIYGQDAEILGPGTDLILALLGVVIMMATINAEINDEKFKNQAETIENQQGHITQRDEKIDKLDEIVETMVIELYELENLIEKKDKTLEADSILIAKYDRDSEYITSIRKQQLEIIHAIAGNYTNSTLDSIDKNNYHIFFGEKDNIPDITIHNDVTLQRISFGNHILFESDEPDLKPKGKKALRVAGRAIKSKIKYIEEMLIHGHTDRDGERDYNLYLGSKRAVSVFIFLVDDVKINPYKNLMSATSFGFYKPFSRKESDTNFSKERVDYANSTEKRKSRNRRIDIVLNYREDM